MKQYIKIKLNLTLLMYKKIILFSMRWISYIKDSNKFILFIHVFSLISISVV